MSNGELYHKCDELVQGRKCRNPGSWSLDGFNYCKRHYETRKRWWEGGTLRKPLAKTKEAATMHDKGIDVHDAMIRQLLESNFWPKEVRSNIRYARVHDDCDGDFSQVLSVVISDDGDAWVQADGPVGGSCRFRVPFIGGGASPRVRNALLILAEAIRMDNEIKVGSWQSKPVVAVDECKLLREGILRCLNESSLEEIRSDLRALIRVEKND